MALPSRYKSCCTLLLRFTKTLFHSELLECMFLPALSLYFFFSDFKSLEFLFFCRLRGYSIETALGVIEDGGKSLKINTHNLRDVSFRVGSIYQFIGELHIQPNNEVCCLFVCLFSFPLGILT